MYGFAFLGVFLILKTTSCRVTRFSTACEKCPEHPCKIKIGLLTNTSRDEAAAIDEVVSIINSEKDFRSNWEIQMYVQIAASCITCSPSCKLITLISN